MKILLYDGSFAGFLTAVFEVYEYKFSDVNITSIQGTASVFEEEHTVLTEEAKAQRVYKGLQQYLSKEALHQLYCTSLSEIKGIENTMLAYVTATFNSKASVEKNFSDRHVLTIAQTARKVHREKHRMEAFVRFQLTKDNLYYAIIEPDYNVLPLISNHFEKRYADQRWMIYDARRRYGIYYDLQTVTTVQITFNEQAGNTPESIYDDKEELYQTLWKQYFKSVNIAARKNTKLHIQHMPKRYWKYLPEKKMFG